jgi:hypothetical protein
MSTSFVQHEHSRSTVDSRSRSLAYEYSVSVHCISALYQHIRRVGVQQEHNMSTV